LSSTTPDKVSAVPGTDKLLAAMFLFYLIGLGVLIASKL
jgi:hypothetical protein